MAATLTQRLQLKLPLWQAPMAGAATPRLAAAVSNAGGLGFLAGGMLSPEALLGEAAALRALSERPFGINLFVQPDEPECDEARLARALERLAPLHAELGLPPPVAPARFCEPFSRQLEALIEARPQVASFTFGILDARQLSALRKAGIAVVGTATNLGEGLAWAELGADAVCAQGREAGGHRGTFLGPAEQSLRPMLSLVYELAQNLPLPVIAAGGIMNGRDMAAAMRHGAQACQLGTAFLRCPESAVSPAWRQGLAAAGGTRLTRAFSGRLARGLENDYMRRMAAWEADLPDYPAMNALSAPLRAAAAQAGRGEYLSMWAGEGVAAARELPAAELAARLHEEWLAAYR